MERGDSIPSLGSQKEMQSKVKAMLWLLNQADGANDLISIADKCAEPVPFLAEIARELVAKDLLRPV